MNEFDTYLESGKIRKKKPDKGKSQGLIQNAKEDLKILQDIELSEETTSFIFKNTYNCIRTALQSYLARDGYKPYTHESIIIYAKKINELSEKQANKIDKYRELRNDIEYRGDTAEEKETEEILEFAEKIIDKVEEKIND